MRSNFHTHTLFCDGQGTPEEYVKKALELGFNALGFSGHAPLPFANSWAIPEEKLDPYLREIRKLKKQYQGSLDIYLGLEIDYISGVMAPDQAKYQRLDLDYTIGSVHLLQEPRSGKYFAVDGPLQEFEYLLVHLFKNNRQDFIAAYYSQVKELVKNHRFSFLGHFDLIKKWNRNNSYFNENEPWYREIVLAALDTIAAAGSMVEVNTGGIARGATTEIYPSPWILKECYLREIPLTLNADAHDPQQLNFHFKEALGKIKESGYSHLMSLNGRQWLRTAI